MLLRQYLLLARAWVGGGWRGPRVSLPTPTAPLARGAQRHMAVLEIDQSQHCWAVVLGGKLILILG